jgi:hypothetical protein
MSLRSLRISAIAVPALLLALLVCGAAQARPRPTPTPSPTPTPVADPAITKLARQQFVAWQAGSINRNAYSAKVQAKLTDAIVNDVSHKLGLLGPLTDLVYLGPFYANDFPPDARGYIYQMLCREGNVYQFMILDGQGKIATIYFKDKLTTEEVEVPATAAPSPEESSPPR